MVSSVSAEAPVINREGLHARPCHAIVSAALKFQSRLRVGCGGREVDGKSILQLMTLSAAQGSVLLFTAEGDDAQALVDRLTALVSAGFEESS